MKLKTDKGFEEVLKTLEKLFESEITFAV